MQCQPYSGWFATPLCLLDREAAWAAKAKLARQGDTADAQRPPSRLCCALCQYPITDQRASLTIAGAHYHVFTNPAGVRYEIALFRQADCISHGTATTEFTWFSDYAWQLALCSNCHVHLGWRYRQTGSEAFYGLIRLYLVELREK